MTIYVVSHTVGGYAREDASTSSVVGVYSDDGIATLVKKSVGGDAKVTPIELDVVPPGYLDFAKNVLGVDILDLMARKDARFRPVMKEEKKDLMTIRKFKTFEKDMVCDDGDGYWATSTEVSRYTTRISKPSWATHVLWCNK